MHILGKRITPNGVNFSDPLSVDYILSGTQLHYSVPEANVSWVKNKDSYSANYDIYSLDYVHPVGVDDDAPKRRSLDRFEWHFWGLPVIERDAYAGLKFNVNVTHLPEFANLFRPHRFMCAVERMLYTNLISRFISSGESRQNWKMTEVNGHEWASHRYHYIGEYNRDNYGFVWQTPISAEHMLTFIFHMDIVKKAKEKSCFSYFDEFMSLFLGSLKLKLSTQSLEDRETAKTQYGHEYMLSKVPPYEFESMECRDRFEWYGKFGEEIEDNHKVPQEVFDKLVKEAMEEENHKFKQIRERVMKSHLRFTELETADLKAGSKAAG